MDIFENLNLDEQLRKAIKRMGFKEPTQIQEETIPLILEGKDVIGESATGSGKTLAFGAGIVKTCHPNKGIQSIVLVPTRELAEQVKGEMEKISYGKKLRILAVYGGVSIGVQIEKLKRTDVVIATPGRLLDHLRRHTINVSKVKVLVLDEADRMVEMGFIEDVRKIIRSCSNRKQTLLFSATMHGPAKQIAKEYMENPVVVHATKLVDPSKLKQVYYDTPGRLKRELLIHLLGEEKSDLVMVFCNTRRMTDTLVKTLKAKGIKSAPIHGGLTQNKRLKTIDLFNHNKFQVLVCTDVASRGLHIEGVTHIYNFDIPKEPGDYVHRIGRTARAGKEGLVINILSSRDYPNFTRVMRTHRDFDIQKKELPRLKKMEHPKEDSSRRFRESKRERNFQRKGFDRSRRDSSERGSFSRRSRRDSRSKSRRGSYRGSPSKKKRAKSRGKRLRPNLGKRSR